LADASSGAAAPAPFLRPLAAVETVRVQAAASGHPADVAAERAGRAPRSPLRRGRTAGAPLEDLPA